MAFRDQPSYATALLGVPFVAVGIYMLSVVFIMWAKQLGRMPYALQADGLSGTIHSVLHDYWGYGLGFVLGCMFFFFGMAMALLTTGTNFDVAKGAVVNWWRVLMIKREKHYQMQEFARVEVAHRRKSFYAKPIFFVSVKGRNHVDILIKTCRELEEANALSRNLAARLRLNLILLAASL